MRGGMDGWRRGRGQRQACHGLGMGRLLFSPPSPSIIIIETFSTSRTAHFLPSPEAARLAGDQEISAEPVGGFLVAGGGPPQPIGCPSSGPRDLSVYIIV